MTKIPLKPEDVVVPGDQIELNFRLSGPLWMQATISAAIENRLSRKYLNFKVLNYSWQDDLFTVGVKVIEPQPAEASGQVQEANIGAVVTVVAICTALLGMALIYWFTQDTTYKIVQTATPAISLMAVAAILYFGLRLFGKGAFAQ